MDALKENGERVSQRSVDTRCLQTYTHEALQTRTQTKLRTWKVQPSTHEHGCNTCSFINLTCPKFLQVAGKRQETLDARTLAKDCSDSPTILYNRGRGGARCARDCGGRGSRGRSASFWGAARPASLMGRSSSPGFMADAQRLQGAGRRSPMKHTAAN